MRQKKEQKENSERWLLTYSDLITLLCALFIILFAISNVDKAKYEEISASFHNELGGGGVIQGGGGISDGQDGVLDGSNGVLDGGNGETQPQSGEGQGEGSNDLTEESQLQEVESQISSTIKGTELEGNVNFSIEDRGLIVSFSDDIFFDSGKAVIKESMMSDFDKIAAILRQFGNPIRIEGHTDNVPIRNSSFASNWQLSCQRAANVVQYLEEKDGITPDRLAATGYGEYKPIASNDTKEGRDKNRRVNLVILYDSEIQ